jgi:hypothetical protein
LGHRRGWRAAAVGFSFVDKRELSFSFDFLKGFLQRIMIFLEAEILIQDSEVGLCLIKIPVQKKWARMMSLIVWLFALRVDTFDSFES